MTPSPHTIHLGKRLAAIAGIFVLVTSGVILLAFGAIARASSGVLLPGISIGGVAVGGLTPEEAERVLRARTDALLLQGFRITAGEHTAIINATTLAPTDPDLSQDRLVFNHDDAVREAWNIGHRGNLLARSISALSLRLRGGAAFPFRFTMNTDALVADIRTALGDAERAKREPGFTVVATTENISFEPLAGERGTRLDVGAAVKTLRSEIRQGMVRPILVPIVVEEPTLAFEDAVRLAVEAKRAVERIPATHASTTVRFDGREWPVTRSAIAGWLVLEETSTGATLAFAPERLTPFFDDIGAQIESPAEDAKFRVDGKRVVEFQPSREGIVIDRDASRRAMQEAWISGNLGPTELVVARTPPKIAVGEINTLGIKDILGVGTSNFSGSPRNRIKNIRNGITKLNGTLIEPGEEFSLLGALRPFTEEGGYLPELVIKGDKVTPELGGGLCQIGTTSFRMAMNAGMKITMRQNHSLVVRYYNDPKNKNPGTDATIYDPSPDFKFVNDTGHYLLVATEMNTATGELKFTLWGTTDGRKGTYDAPTLLKWYPAGDDKEILTTDLKPGERKCQEKHPGADASFVYTRTLPSGIEEKKTYTSHYRSLPKICLVGVTADQMPATTGSPSAPDANVDAAAPAN